MIRFCWLLWCVIVVYIWMCLLGQLITLFIRSLFSENGNGKNCRVLALSFVLKHAIWTRFGGIHFIIIEHTHTYISHLYLSSYIQFLSSSVFLHPHFRFHSHYKHAHTHIHPNKIYTKISTQPPTNLDTYASERARTHLHIHNIHTSHVFWIKDCVNVFYCFNFIDA